MEGLICCDVVTHLVYLTFQNFLDVGKAYTEKYDHVKRPWKVSENMLKRRSKTRVLMQESKAFSVTYFFMVAFVTYSWYGPTGNQMVNVNDTFEKVAPLHAVIRTALCTIHVVNSLIV